jgi:hypothetical protein
MCLCPINGSDKASSEERDVKPELRSGRVGQLLPFSQEIEQQRSEAAVLQDFRNRAIARAMAATAASVRKQHQSVRLSRQAQIAAERDIGDVETHGPGRHDSGRDAHDDDLPGFPALLCTNVNP